MSVGTLAARKLLCQLRKEAGVLCAPVDLLRICSILNLELFFGDLGNVDGVFFSGGDNEQRGVILVNEKRSHERRRFTVAHEIGHAVMHHSAMSFLDKKNALSSWQETQANEFAAELLMPKMLLVQKGHATPEQISKQFCVSLRAATIRAEQLGWLKSPV